MSSGSRGSRVSVGRTFWSSRTHLLPSLHKATWPPVLRTACLPPGGLRKAQPSGASPRGSHMRNRTDGSDFPVSLPGSPRPQGLVLSLRGGAGQLRELGSQLTPPHTPWTPSGRLGPFGNDLLPPTPSLPLNPSHPICSPGG